MSPSVLTRTLDVLQSEVLKLIIENEFNRQNRNSEAGRYSYQTVSALLITKPTNSSVSKNIQEPRFRCGQNSINNDGLV